ncbi:MAG: type IV secretion system DNA-binding domain-containing protein [bacterium]|nr:type IV secretion system DNA-binding domain-containing protein [bacterium]
MQEDPEKITYFAQTNSRGKEVPFGIKRRDRARHFYTIGKTGMGKSTLLENMAIQDIRNGEGIAFIDPHGSTAERILEYVPEHRIRDVLYFAPFDMDYPIAFNVMEDVGYDKRHLVVSGLLSAFRKIWVDAWSARMEYILSNTLLALLEFDGSTLLDVNRMLINKVFRKKVVENVTDPIVKSFWVDEFANYGDRYTQEATPAIQNKIGQFTSNPLIRNIVGQPKSSFDIRQMMDEKKIIIMNLSKGRVGEINASLLGSMLVTKLYLAAMSRADVPAPQLARLPSFYFYVDEFQTFANQSFADILSEARKYKLNLIIAHQYIEQMEEEVRDAVFGNVGTTVAFRVGPFDAEVLETVFQPQFTQTDLVNLGFAQVYLTLMIDGVGSPPFSATTLAPFDPPPQNFTRVALEHSRRQFAKSRAEVEVAIAKWHEPEPPAPKKPAPAVSAPPPPAPVLQVAPTPAPAQPVSQRSLPNRQAGSGFPARQQSPGGQGGVRPFARQVAPSHPTPPPPYKKPGTQERPPLGGTNSLREALAMVTGKQTPTSPVAKPATPALHTTHAPDLKETLGKIVASSPPKHPGLSEKALRDMLAVTEVSDENA